MNKEQYIKKMKCGRQKINLIGKYPNHVEWYIDFKNGTVIAYNTDLDEIIHIFEYMAGIKDKCSQYDSIEDYTDNIKALDAWNPEIEVK